MSDVHATGPRPYTGYGTQIRKSPFFEATLRYGCRGFSVYNPMYIPRDFGDPVENYWNLVERVILCDVSVERQVEISGPDAFSFIRTLTPTWRQAEGSTSPRDTPL